MSLKDEFHWQSRMTDKLADYLSRNANKLLAFLFWLTVIGAYWWLTDQYDLLPDEKIKLLAGIFVNDFFGPLLFILFFSLQPLVFFPSFLLGIAGGILYGPIDGTLYVIVGANSAANICYLVGRYFGRGVVENNQQTSGLLQRYTQRLRENTFETILIMHLLVIIPFDLVNYVAGFLKMNWRQFALATAIGAVPGVITFVLLGNSLGSIDNLAAGQPNIDTFTLGLSGVALLVGLGLSQLVKRWERHHRAID